LGAGKISPHNRDFAMRRFGESNLWLGNSGDAKGFRALFDRGIEVVVDLAFEEMPSTPPRQVVYCRFPLLDGPGNPTWLLQMAIDLTSGFVRSRKPTLVCCSMGMSRSPCIAAAALARAFGGSPADYLKLLLASGPGDIAAGLWNEVLQAFEALGQLQPAHIGPVRLTP
jgi:protein-tyrosine phosphatase